MVFTWAQTHARPSTAVLLQLWAELDALTRGHKTVTGSLVSETGSGGSPGQETGVGGSQCRGCKKDPEGVWPGLPRDQGSVGRVPWGSRVPGVASQDPLATHFKNGA